MPPTSRDYPMGNLDAPLSQWPKKVTTYRDKDECEHVLDQQRRLSKQNNRMITYKFYLRAQCVAADDPRLKAK
jgi:hypothetical protein